MRRRILSVLLVSLVGIVLFYLSQFWPFRWWSNQGLFGMQAIRPQGDLVSLWLRGTSFAAFDLVIWALGSILLLTGLQKVFDAMTPKSD